MIRLKRMYKYTFPCRQTFHPHPFMNYGLNYHQSLRKWKEKEEGDESMYTFHLRLADSRRHFLYTNSTLDLSPL